MAGGKSKRQSNEAQPISFGYIVIPSNVDRDLYVESCLRRGRVCVMKEGGVFNMDLYITNEALQNIHFPKNTGEKGTAVVIANNPFIGTQMVIGTLIMNDESPVWSEDIFRFRKIINNTSTSLLLDPKNNVINLSIDSSNPIQLNIKATGSDSSVVKVFSSGEVNVEANNNISATSYKQIETKIVNVEKPEEESRSVIMDLEKVQVSRTTEEGKTSTITLDDNQFLISFKDEEEKVQLSSDNILISFKNGEEIVEMKQDEVNVTTNKTFKVNGGTYSFAKSETLIEKIDQLQSQISLLKQAFTVGMNAAIPIATSDQGKAAFTAASGSVASIQKVDFNEIKSKVSFSD